jgi:transcriptional regulator with XRE-family HTH domain
MERRATARYRRAMVRPSATAASSVGELIRDWRQRRRKSQLELALDAEISSRHLSFVETGRAQPSREMILHLAEQLDIPLRERNALLLAAGYAPVFPERPISDPALDSARAAVDLVLTAHEPYPALAIDRYWNLVAAMPMLEGASAELLKPPVNVLRLSLHPDGVASRIANLSQWSAHLFARLGRQIELTADPLLIDLLKELKSYSPSQPAHAEHGGVAVPLEFDTPAGRLSFLSTTMVFGTPVDITLSELAIESFFPADAATAAALARLQSQTSDRTA